MNKFLIIGNGFDLHHNLPTSYNHFIAVLKTIEVMNTKNEHTFDDIFENIDNSFKEKIQISYNTSNIKFSSTHILSIKERIIANTWYQYFKEINISEIKSWIDFELQIEEALEIVNFFFNQTTKLLAETSIRELIYVKLRGSDNTTAIYLNSNQFKKLFHLNLIRRSDFSYSYSVRDNLLKENENIYAIDEKKILSELSNSLQEFIQIFNDYFMHIIQPFYANYNHIEIIKNLYENTETIQNKIEHGGWENNHKFNAIYSFNYTPTIIEFYQTSEIKYLHGKFGEKQNMVLGFSGQNEEWQDHNLFAFTKYYQKLYKNTDYNFFHDVTSFAPQTNIYFWGHSLDQSDKEYILEVFSLLKKRPDLVYIIVFYHEDVARAAQLQNLLKICGKDVIEKAMKSSHLTFQKSTNENLLQMIYADGQ